MSDLMNPYAAPKADDSPAPPVEGAAELNYASMGVRFANYVIDTVARILLRIPLGMVMTSAGIASNDFISRVAIQSVMILVYSTLLEGLFGVTIGKLITGTRVVDELGNRPTFGQILGRSFTRLVPFEPFSFFNNPSIGWHDRWSGTRVVKVRR
jgi:uncharacterized RDD family membrane protein YckC